LDVNAQVGKNQEETKLPFCYQQATQGNCFRKEKMHGIPSITARKLHQQGGLSSINDYGKRCTELCPIQTKCWLVPHLDRDIMEAFASIGPFS